MSKTDDERRAGEMQDEATAEPLPVPDEVLDEVAGGYWSERPLTTHWGRCGRFRSADGQQGRECCKRCKWMVVRDTGHFCTVRGGPDW